VPKQARKGAAMPRSNPGDGKHHFHHQASAWSILRGNVAAVMAYEVARDRQAQAGAAGLVMLGISLRVLHKQIRMFETEGPAGGPGQRRIAARTKGSGFVVLAWAIWQNPLSTGIVAAQVPRGAKRRPQRR